MCVRFLRNTESPHVSVFYQAWVSLVIALCATLIPRALGHTASIRQVHGWVEWTFMAGVGEAADCWAWCCLLSMLVQLVAACTDGLRKGVHMAVCSCIADRCSALQWPWSYIRTCLTWGLWEHVVTSGPCLGLADAASATCVRQGRFRLKGTCCTGLTSYGSQICMTNALRFARAAPALAMSYVSVIITLVYGYFIFNEVKPALPCTYTAQRML